jgi:hypothetical protein
MLGEEHMTEQQEKAMRRALAALNSFDPHDDEYWYSERSADEIDAAIAELRQALAQQEPDEFCTATTEELMKTLGCSDEKAKEIHDKVEALAQPEQEPEPKGHCTCGDPTLLGYVHFRIRPCIYYTAPPKREWVGLTGEDIDRLTKMHLRAYPTYPGFYGQTDFARAIDALLKEKNT